MTLLGWLQGLPWTRIEIFIFFLIFISMLRWPGKEPTGMLDLLERHWGDWVGIFLVSVGVSVTLYACLHAIGMNPAALIAISNLGGQLVGAGLTALKLKAIAATPNNGTGDGTTTETETQPPASPQQPQPPATH